MKWWEALLSILADAKTKQDLEAMGATPHEASMGPHINGVPGSGYSVEADRRANALKLRMACDAAIVNPAWAPVGEVTHCNGAAAEIASAMGCQDLNGLMADAQLAKMSATPGWLEDSPDRAVLHAYRGGLAFAACFGYPHGHIAALMPDPMEYSPSWACDVPIVANVGRTNHRCKLSEAFLMEQRPGIRFFLWGTP